MEKFLIADDNLQITKILSEFSKKEGFQPIVAHDGVEAVELFKQGHFSIILLDVMMPGKDGFEVCREIRRSSNIPVLIGKSRLFGGWATNLRESDMRHKITHRLVGYFSAALLLFSMIAGSMFWILFTWHTTVIQQEELKERAVTSPVPSPSSLGEGRGDGAYLRFIDDIAMSEAWLVDERAQTIQMGRMGGRLSYDELPAGAERLIRQVFAGNVEVNREFSSIVGAASITVGAPVYDANGRVVAALLLAVALSAALARHFIDPLKKMGRATQQMRQGNYSVRTGVEQDDEIGSLASDIDNLSTALSQVEEQREALDRIRRDFVSNISHELRTPVTVLKGSLEVLAEGLVSDTQEMREYFQQMLTDTAHLERLINDLLELSRLQNASFKIEKTELNLTDVLSDAIWSMQRISDQRKVQIIWENETGAVLFHGDYGRLRQMFMIILDNAVKFSPPEDTPYIFDRFIINISI